MANKDQDQPKDQLENVENSLGAAELFVEDNKDKLLVGIGIVLALILGVWGYTKFIKTPKEQKASAQMAQAEMYLELDSINLALNGDANYPGFLGIIDKFSGTKAANNAKYYAGACYMKLGQFDNAIKMLDGFSSKDPLLSSLSLSLKGDAFVEKKDINQAIKLYNKAVNEANGNEFASPYILQKIAVVYENQNNYSEAVAIYEKIRNDYPNSTEARSADKYIQELNIKLGK